MLKKIHTGFSLLEILITLSMLSILTLLSLRLPIIDSAIAKAELASLHQFLLTNRQYAISQNKQIIISQISNAIMPTSSRSLISFVDINLDQQQTASLEPTLYRFNFQSAHSHLYSTHIDKIIINHLGMNHRIGSIIYCYNNTSYLFTKKISLSMQGRFNIKDSSNKKCIS